jgi:hypothetical protein
MMPDRDGQHQQAGTLVSLRCGRQQHRLRLGRQGEVTLLDHDLAAEQAALGLGGREAGCLHWLAALRQPDRLLGLAGDDLVPNALRPRMRAAQAQRLCHELSGFVPNVGPYSRRPYGRGQRHVEPLRRGINRDDPLEDALMDDLTWGSYAAPVARLLQTARRLLPATMPAGVRGTVRYTRLAPACLLVGQRLTMLVGKDWWRVYYRGLAVLDGWPVLALLPSEGPGQRVLAARWELRFGQMVVAQPWPAIWQDGVLRWDAGWTGR